MSPRFLKVGGQRICRSSSQPRCVGHQHEDGEGDGLDGPAVASAAGRSGDRLMDRRAFIGTLAGGLLASPLGAEAQPAEKVYRIGFLSGQSPTDLARQLEAFRPGLRQLGYVEGRNIAIEDRFAEG